MRKYTCPCRESNHDCPARSHCTEGSVLLQRTGRSYGFVGVFCGSLEDCVWGGGAKNIKISLPQRPWALFQLKMQIGLCRHYIISSLLLSVMSLLHVSWCAMNCCYGDLVRLVHNWAKQITNRQACSHDGHVGAAFKCRNAHSLPGMWFLSLALSTHSR
jgi:hypothetical protein